MAVVYATAARGGLSEFAVFYNSIRFTRNHICIHARLLHMTSCTFGCGGVGGVVTSVCTFSHLWYYARHVFLTWSHIPSGGVRGYGNVSVHLLTSFMLRSTCLPCKFYHVKHVLLKFTREVRRQMVARSHLARRFWTNVGITVKVSFQTLSIQRTRRTNYWMLRSGAMSTNGNGDTIIAMPCGRDGGHIRPYPRGHIRPYPKRDHIRPYPTILPVDCVIQPFRARPGDNGLLGGGVDWGTFRGDLQTQLKSLPSLLKMSLNLLG